MGDTVEVVVGVIGRGHGLRGDVAIDLRTDEPDRRFAVGQVLRDEGTGQRFTVAASRYHSGRLLVRFDEPSDRTAVDTVRGTRLVVDVPADEAPAEDGDYYDRQLVGLRVRDAAGTDVGWVTEVVHLPAQDALQVSTAGGPRLVPFVHDLVPVVDLDQGFVRLADVPGLLSDVDD